ncbi:MAG: hypothetical protein ABIH63_02780 [archaeon]
MVSKLVKDVLEIYDRKELVDNIEDTTDRLVVLLGERLSSKYINPNTVDGILYLAIEAGVNYGVKTSDGLIDYLRHLSENDKALIVRKFASGVSGL